MLQRLVFLLKYFSFWTFYFLFLKTVFILFNFELSKILSIKEFAGIYWYGLKLDISISSYLLVIPFLLILPTIFSNSRIFKSIINWYTYIFLILISFLAVGDMELYKYWGFRLDTTPLLYINTPGEMVASVEWYVALRQIVIWILLVLAAVWFYKKVVLTAINKIGIGKWWELPISLVLMASLIIPIRGGFGLAPINTGSAYFCENDFANHSAINMLWNVGFSLSRYEGKNNPYKLMSNEEADAMFETLKSSDSAFEKVIKSKRPNIILIMVESLTAKVVEPLGGKPGITPRLNELCKQGIFFTNFYSSGVRSDKGIVAILSGFPAQPNNSIIQYPNKTEKLPFLSRDLMHNGYNTAYYYGGNIDFASMRSYIRNGRYQHVIDMDNFPATTYNAKWGVHDHIVFSKFFADLNYAASPFFYTLFTLSSHEPFDVPMKTVIEGTDFDSKFLNSMYYTDSCLGNFIDSAKTKPWWKNTLIIITADHGATHPDNSPNYAPIRYHIPMLWIGGAVKKDTVISKICSQTDITLTLLEQLSIKPEKEYIYSNNIFNRNFKGFAFFSYTRGLGFLTDSSKVSYDFDQKKVKISEGDSTGNLLKIGQAYLQVVYNDYLLKK